MATKTTTKRKTTSGRATTKKGTACAAKGARLKLAGETFTVLAYSSSKTQAQTMAAKHRSKGLRAKARVTKTVCGYRVAVKG